MRTVYRKTAKGIAEIETRALRLAPRPRSALILVDGKKTDDELIRMILSEPKETLASLLAGGFIEVLATLADGGPPTRSASPPAVPKRVGLDSAASFEALRRAAARDLNHQLGPNAEVVSIKIERAKTMPELQPLLVQAAQMLHRLKGAAVAEAFAERFIKDAQS